MANLKGIYQISKSNLTSNSHQLVIGTRRSPELTKPKNYLLLKKSAKAFEYISSLYPVKDALNTFQIDYNGIQYILSMDADKGKAIIEAISDPAIIEKEHNSNTVPFTSKMEETPICQ